MMQKLKGETLRDHLIDYFKLNLNMGDDGAEEVAEEVIGIMIEHIDEIQT